MSPQMVALSEILNLGCHGEQKKCLHINGRHMHICARCTGCIIGHLSAIVSFFFIRYGIEIYWIAAIFLAMMYADWTMQNKLNWYHSNLSRLITGMLGGFAVAVSLINLMLFLFTGMI